MQVIYLFNLSLLPLLMVIIGTINSILQFYLVVLLFCLFTFLDLLAQVLYVDMDGSLTDQPGGGWVMPNSPLVPPQHCRSSIPEFSGNHSSHNGTVCSAAVNFLRVSWNQAQPLVRENAVILCFSMTWNLY